jgi:putative endonuclease
MVGGSNPPRGATNHSLAFRFIAPGCTAVRPYASDGEAEMHRLVRLKAQMKFFYVYVLKSIKKSFMYVGFTSNLKRRFEEHNLGLEFSTKPYFPFDLIHYEAYKNENDAKRRERYFKTTKGKTTLKMILKEFLES